MAESEETQDPVYLHSRREAIVILLVWGISFLWTVPYCYLNGYQTTQENWQLTTQFGMPSWIFYGIAIPWFVAGLISILLCLFFIQDDDLGHAADEAPLE